MVREKFYTQSLSKRISFVCKKCSSEMMFQRKPKRIIIECKNCGIYFVFTSRAISKSQNVILWGKTNYLKPPK